MYLEQTHVEHLQVIWRPGPSTIGKSNQHRLFLRFLFLLRRLSGPSIPRELSDEVEDRTVI